MNDSQEEIIESNKNHYIKGGLHLLNKRSEDEDSLQRGSSIEINNNHINSKGVLKSETSSNQYRAGAGSIRNNAAASHHSKATSLVQRKTSDLYNNDEEELQYSESNIENTGTHYFQLESQQQQTGGMPLYKRPTAVVEQQQQENIVGQPSQPFRRKWTNSSKNVQNNQQSQIIGNDGGIVQGFINDVNFECTQLLSKLQSDNNKSVTNVFENRQKTGSPLINSKSASGPINNIEKKQSVEKPYLDALQRRSQQNYSNLKEQESNTHKLNDDSEKGGSGPVGWINRERTGTTYDLQKAAGLINSEHYATSGGVNGAVHSTSNADQEGHIENIERDIILHPSSSAENHSDINRQSNKMTFRQQQEEQEQLPAQPFMSEGVRDDLEEDDDGFSRAMTAEQMALLREVEKLRAQKSSDIMMTNTSKEERSHSGLNLVRDDSQQEKKKTENYSKIGDGNDAIKEQQIKVDEDDEYEQDEQEFEAMDDEDDQDEVDQQNNEESESDDDQEIIQGIEALTRNNINNNHAQDHSIVQIEDQNTNHQQSQNQPPHQFTDDVVYNRLPKNFFVSEPEEHFDLGEVMASIQKMRTDFQGYMHEGKVQERLEEINDMILQPPEQFIQRQLKAMGLEGAAEELLFEKIIPESPLMKKESVNDIAMPSSINYQGNNNRSSLTRSGMMMMPDGHSITMRETKPPTTAAAAMIYQTTDQPDMFSLSHLDDNVQQRATSAGRVQFCDPIPNYPTRRLQEAIEDRGNVAEIQERLKRKDYEPFPNRQDELSPKSISSNNRIVKQPRTEQVRHIKEIKMADYFKEVNNSNNQHQTITSGGMINGLMDQDTIQEEEDCGGTRASSPGLQQAENEEELPEDIKEQLVQRLEEDILGNIDVNFLFNKGDKLRFGLIDQSRLYKIMMKIKEIAHKQIQEKGSKQIDYIALVRYLEEEDEFHQKGDQSEILIQQNAIQHSKPTVEPFKTKIPKPKEEFLDESQWVHIFDFMRKNPKLMLQMLPDNLEENQPAVVQNANTQQGVKQQQTEEAKKVKELKALSSKFTNNRKDFLEAIDRYQENQLILSSPKGNPQQQQKAIQVKSISQNQRKIKKAHAQQQQQQNQRELQDNILISSDGEAAAVRLSSQDRQVKPLIFQKQFNYSSASQAKNVYNAPPFEVPVEEKVVNQGNENNQIQVNQQQETTGMYNGQHSMLDQLATKTTATNKRKGAAGNSQIKSYQTRQRDQAMQPVKSQLTNLKKSVISNQSNMGDNTTLAGTGNFTNMKNYRNHQIHTISQEDPSERDAVASTTSMFSKFVKPVVEHQPTSQRRPITANAAMGGGHKKSNLARINAAVVFSQDSQSNTNMGDIVLNQKSSAQFVRQPSASGMSSFTQENRHAKLQIDQQNTSQTQFPKFVKEKKAVGNWMSSGQHIKEVAKQSEEINTSIKHSSTVVSQTAKDLQIQSQTTFDKFVKVPATRLPPDIEVAQLKKTKTNRDVSSGRYTQQQSFLQSEARDSGNVSPAPKTQDYISKIAPSIKADQKVEKFANRIRQQNGGILSANDKELDLSQIDPKSIGQSVNSSFSQNLKQRRSEIQASRAALKKGNNQTSKFSSLNQSAVHQKEDEKSQGTGRLNQTVYEQTPQGEFPKFINPSKSKRYSKVQLTAANHQRFESSHSASRPLTSDHQPLRVSSHLNVSVGAEERDLSPGYGSSSSNIVEQRRQVVSQQLQTNIGGVNNKLLVSPGSAVNGINSADGCRFGNNDPTSDDFEEDGEQGSLKRRQLIAKNKLLLPIVDWAFTPMFERALNDDISFNKEKDLSIYEEKEVDYVIDMMKNKYKDFKRSDIMRPFYLKAQLTLKALFAEQTHDTHFEKLMHKYREITIENTMKLLIRCKLAFHSRVAIFEILKHLLTYELHSMQFRELVQKYYKHKVDQSEYDLIQDAGTLQIETGYQLLLKINALRKVHKQYRVPFIFKKKDYMNYVKSEMNEARRLIFAFRVRTEQDIQEEQKQREEEEKILQRFLSKMQQYKDVAEINGVPFNEEDFKQKYEEGEYDTCDEEEEPEDQETDEQKRAKLLSPLRIIP